MLPKQLLISLGVFIVTCIGCPENPAAGEAVLNSNSAGSCPTYGSLINVKKTPNGSYQIGAKCFEIVRGEQSFFDDTITSRESDHLEWDHVATVYDISTYGLDDSDCQDCYDQFRRSGCPYASGYGCDFKCSEDSRNCPPLENVAPTFFTDTGTCSYDHVSRTFYRGDEFTGDSWCECSDDPGIHVFEMRETPCP